MLIVSYTWYGRTPVKLTVKPLLPMRPIHDLRAEHGGFIQKVNLKPGRVTIQPVLFLLPPIGLDTMGCSWDRLIGGVASSIRRICAVKCTNRKTCGHRGRSN